MKKEEIKRHFFPGFDAIMESIKDLKVKPKKRAKYYGDYKPISLNEIIK